MRLDVNHLSQLPLDFLILDITIIFYFWTPQTYRNCFDIICAFQGQEGEGGWGWGYGYCRKRSATNQVLSFKQQNFPQQTCLLKTSKTKKQRRETLFKLCLLMSYLTYQLLPFKFLRCSFFPSCFSFHKCFYRSYVIRHMSEKAFVGGCIYKCV